MLQDFFISEMKKKIVQKHQIYIEKTNEGWWVNYSNRKNKIKQNDWLFFRLSVCIREANHENTCSV